MIREAYLKIVSLVFGFAALILASCAGAPSSDEYTTAVVRGKVLTFDRNLAVVAEKPNCPFVFTKELGNQLFPLLKKNLGQDIIYYDIGNPGVVLYRERAELGFGASLVARDGTRLVDPQEFIIVLDVCNHSVMKFYFVNSVP
jgi:hypothetical protein